MMVKNQYLATFRVGTKLLGVPISTVQEVVKVPKIMHIAQPLEFVVGVINLRGRIIPIVDMHKRLLHHAKQIATKYDNPSRILIVVVRGHLIGWIVDEVGEIIKLTSTRAESAPQVVSNQQNQVIKGVRKFENRPLILVDIEHVFTAADMQQFSHASSGILGMAAA